MLVQQVAIEIERDLIKFYDKNLNTDRKLEKAKWQHETARKNFDYTTIADRLTTFSWSYNIHSTGVIKQV